MFIKKKRKSVNRVDSIGKKLDSKDDSKVTKLSFDKLKSVRQLNSDVKFGELDMIV